MAEFKSAHSLNSRTRLVILSGLYILCFLAYLLWNLQGHQLSWDSYAIQSRLITLAAIAVNGIAIGTATMLFYAIANNRILTPSILGLDNLYIFAKVLGVFIVGSGSFLAMSHLSQFTFAVVIMVGYALLLYSLFFKGGRHNVFFLLLIGIILSTLFDNLASFMTILIDPVEFLTVQDINFGGFNRIQPEILLIAFICLIPLMIYALHLSPILDVMALGRENAISLGVNYDRYSKKIMVVVACLIAIATALAGPLLFLGILVLNITLQRFPSHQFKQLIPSAMLVSLLALTIAQFMVFHLMNFRTELSVIINFVGGTYFIYILLRENKKWLSR